MNGLIDSAPLRVASHPEQRLQSDGRVPTHLEDLLALASLYFNLIRVALHRLDHTHVVVVEQAPAPQEEQPALP